MDAFFDHWRGNVPLPLLHRHQILALADVADDAVVGFTVFFAFVIGMLVVLALVKIASRGYTFGQYLAQQKTQP